MNDIRVRRVLVAASFGVLLVMFEICAWQGDDAFITWRTVDNAVNGYGLRWNVEERVQSYTSPLWMLVGLCSRFLFGEVYFSMLGVSILMALLAAVMLVRLGKEVPGVGLVVPWALIASNAFIDFSVSGMENPLCALLLAGLCHAAHRQNLLRVSLVTALLALGRPDAVILAVPVLLLTTWTNRHNPKMGPWLATGFAPLLFWECVSLVYYGSLVPNAAWAKLNVLIPKADLYSQGMAYLANSFTHDPVTLVLVIGGSIVAWFYGQRPAKALVLGVLLYLYYVVSIGGDFMSGRFLYMPYVQAIGAVILAIRGRAVLAGHITLAAAIALCAYWVAWPNSRFPTHAPNASMVIIDAHGIADERAYYYPTTGLLNVLGDWPALPAPLPPYRGAFEGLKYKASTGWQVAAVEVGYLGYFAGPGTLVLDRCGLTDPFLSRIPFRPQGPWRVGHYLRDFPDGYWETRITHENRLTDHRYSALYEDVRLVASGPLWTSARWAAIWRLNSGYYRFE